MSRFICNFDGRFALSLRFILSLIAVGSGLAHADFVFVPDTDQLPLYVDSFPKAIVAGQFAGDERPMRAHRIGPASVNSSRGDGGPGQSSPDWVICAIGAAFISSIHCCPKQDRVVAPTPDLYRLTRLRFQNVG